jgi:hypothetical protein
VNKPKNDIALVKETGEILGIKSSYGTFIINMDFPEGVFSKEQEEKIKEYSKLMFESNVNIGKEVLYESDGFKFTREIDEEKTPKMKYLLENGIEYKEDELIIGLDNIRELKINKLNGI